MTETYMALALNVAMTAHKGQVDKAGEPYINHLLRVVIGASGRGKGRTTMIVALLHDVLEDSDMTAEDLLNARICEEDVLSIQLLTRTTDVTYMDYIRAICASDDPVAIAVKQADIADHLQDTDSIPASLIRRYNTAQIELLMVK